MGKSRRVCGSSKTRNQLSRKHSCFYPSTRPGLPTTPLPRGTMSPFCSAAAAPWFEAEEECSVTEERRKKKKKKQKREGEQEMKKHE